MATTLTVTLTWDEIEQASFVGVRRHTRSRRSGRKDAHGLDPEKADIWGSDIEAAAAEMAVAKITNRFWSGSLETFSGDDVQGGIQVRHRLAEPAHLIVRVTDRDDAIFVLVTGRAPQFLVHGWMFGREAKQARWQKAPAHRAPCYMVPSGLLKDPRYLQMRDD